MYFQDQLLSGTLRVTHLMYDRKGEKWLDTVDKVT